MGAGEEVGEWLIVGVWLGVAWVFGWRGNRRAGFCAAGFELQTLRIRIDGCAHFCAQENPRNTARIVPETPESAKFGTKIQVRVVCPKSPLKK